ncbi:MAG: hypothetical protein ABI539_05090, partial [Acidobacteriota bacterium]
EPTADDESYGKTSIYELELEVDTHGGQLYIERRDGPDGERLVWYTVEESTGIITRRERRGFGIHASKLGTSEWV